MMKNNWAYIIFVFMCINVQLVSAAIVQPQSFYVTGRICQCDLCRIIAKKVSQLPLESIKPNQQQGYNKQLKQILADAKDFLMNIENPEKYAIVFGIGETIVNPYKICVYSYVSPSFQTMLKCEGYQPISMVIDLYKYLVAKGFKIYFLSSTPCFDDETYAMIECMLKVIGCNVYEKLILMSYNNYCDLCVDEIYAWKAAERYKIGQQYQVIATFDDELGSLSMENVGYPVLVPKCVKEG